MKEEFSYIVDQFADLQILRYQVPGFANLSLRQKQLLYHLSEAALTAYAGYILYRMSKR